MIVMRNDGRKMSVLTIPGCKLLMVTPWDRFKCNDCKTDTK